MLKAVIERMPTRMSHVTQCCTLESKFFFVPWSLSTIFMQSLVCRNSMLLETKTP